MAVLSLALFALAQAGHPRMWRLWGYLFGQAVFGGPAEIAFDSILPDLVCKHRLVRINGLLQSWGMTDNSAEAAVSGVVLALWRPAPISLFNGIMYLFGSSSALSVPASSGAASHKPRKDRWRPWAGLRFTVQCIARERLLRQYILLAQIGKLIFAPLFFMAPLVSSALDMGSKGYGFSQSLTLGAVLAGNPLASSIGTQWPKVKLWIGGQILYALGFRGSGRFRPPGWHVLPLRAWMHRWARLPKHSVPADPSV